LLPFLYPLTLIVITISLIFFYFLSFIRIFILFSNFAFRYRATFIPFLISEHHIDTSHIWWAIYQFSSFNNFRDQVRFVHLCFYVSCMNEFWNSALSLFILISVPFTIIPKFFSLFFISFCFPTHAIGILFCFMFSE